MDADSVDCSIRGDAIKSGEGIGRCGVDESTAELMCGISIVGGFDIFGSERRCPLCWPIILPAYPAS